MVAESALGEQSLSPCVSLPWIIFNELFILPADSLLWDTALNAECLEIIMMMAIGKCWDPDQCSPCRNIWRRSLMPGVDWAQRCNDTGMLEYLWEKSPLLLSLLLERLRTLGSWGPQNLNDHQSQPKLVYYRSLSLRYEEWNAQTRGWDSEVFYYRELGNKKAEEHSRRGAWT